MTANSDYRRALREAQREPANMKKAYKFLLRAHTKGDSNATYALATWYLFGRASIIEKNLSTAVTLLKKAAKAKHADALHDLAVCYAKGVGVRRSDRKAIECYLQSAVLGDEQSAFEVGRCYWHGIGVKRDRRIANIWLAHADRVVKHK